MILPIGPIHPGLKEPLRLKLQTEGEKVVKAPQKRKEVFSDYINLKMKLTLLINLFYTTAFTL